MAKTGREVDLIGQPSGRGGEEFEGGRHIRDGDKGERDVEVSGSTSKITMNKHKRQTFSLLVIL